MTDSFF